MTYLDTHAVIKLMQKEMDSFSRRAQQAIERDDDLRISPIVVLEVEFLREIGRAKWRAEDIVNNLAGSIGLVVCELPFLEVTRQAAEERWTRDPFDRIIVAQARLGDATLITRDQHMLKRYPKALA